MEKVKIGKKYYNGTNILSVEPTSWEKEGETKHAVKVTLITKSVNDKGYNQHDVDFVQVADEKTAIEICENC